MRTVLDVCAVAMVVASAWPAIAQETKSDEQTENTAQAPVDKESAGENKDVAGGSAHDIEVSLAPPGRSLPPLAAAGDLKKKLDKALAELAHEPGLAELQSAALRFADADVEPTKNWLKAPNYAALLPVLKFVAEHDMERDESLDRYQDEPDRWGADTDRDLGFQISAQWQLSGLVFSYDEVRAYNALANRASRREAILTLLTGYFYERRRLQVYLRIAPPTDLVKMAELTLKIEELTAMIDALTGGLLTRNLKKRKLD